MGAAIWAIGQGGRATLQVWDPLDCGSAGEPRSLSGVPASPAGQSGLWAGAGASPPSARPRAWRPAGDKSLSGSSGPRRPRKPPRRRGPAGAGAGGAGGHLRGRRRPKKEGARGRSFHPATPNRDEPGGSGRGMRQQPAQAGPAPLGRKVGSCLAPGAPRLSRASLPGTRTPAVPAQRSERGPVPRNHTRSGAERWSPPGGLGTAVSLHH